MTAGSDEITGAQHQIQGVSPQLSTEEVRALRSGDLFANVEAKGGDCWRGGEGHPTPSRSIVWTPKGGLRVAPSDVGYGIWLDGKPGTLFAFCA
jgi:hypothetical protein